MNRNLAIATVATAASPVSGTTGASAYDAHNARAVDGLRAVPATDDQQHRAGKIVATDGDGHLPDNIIKQAPAAGDVKCTACIDALKLGTTNAPADNQVLGYSGGILGGYSGSAITAGAVGSTIAGGGNSTYPNLVTDSYGTVAGGLGNQAGDKAGTVSDQMVATVGGGGGNVASGDYSTIGGGYFSTASAHGAVVAGGSANKALASQSTVAGGSLNTASGENATVVGGGSNSASGISSIVLGGVNNSAKGSGSIAMGGGAIANNYDSFVYNGDYTTTQHDSGAGSFTVRAPGGVFLYTRNDVGATLPAGSGSWTTLSDRRSKHGIRRVRYARVLRKLRVLPVHTWAYNAEKGGVRHMGPMAQAFYRRFGLGESNKFISTVDAEGVALAAIKGLDAKVRRQGREIAHLENEVGK